ncbi:FixH family protein [Pararhodobacter zhoushanensis]|uniref:FixH family protein n=1 Tax=Pararhodobacter zhoushanensis TaxID=2479545 RepID=UPI0015F2E8A3|nr:FixH family protein [Pararhodobacter zhoushanensis]
MADTAGRELTGRKVLAITVSAFSVIIGVNLVMAYYAVGTFPGLEVANSYVASQGFNDRMRAQQALGWTTEADMTGGQLTVRITTASGDPAPVAAITAILGRPTTEREDTIPDLAFNGAAYVAPVDVDYGNWDLRISAESADGTQYDYRVGVIHNP